MARGMITMRAIIPKKMNPKVFKLGAKRALRKETTAMAKEFRRVTKNWKPPRVTYKKEVSKGATTTTNLLGIKISSQSMAGTTSTMDKRMRFVNYGSNIRYKAILTKSWRPMTSPNTLNTQRRRGRVLAINKQVSGKRIRARNFDKSVVKVRRKPFVKNVRAEMEKAALQLF